MITSADNNKLKGTRRLAARKQRDITGRFVAEGEDLIAAAEAAGWQPVWQLSVAGSGLPGEEVAPKLLADVSVLGSGTRTLAVYEQRWATALAAPCIALWGVHDPGNVGTVLRSAAAFGAASVALGPECADPYSPKAVRASMGAIFSMPVMRVAGPGELPAPRVGLAAREGEPLEGIAAIGTLLVGGERKGLPADVLAACEATAHIPILTESLNAAMAATIGLYEANRIARRNA
jgi:TrmH family RNA methyltransferase